VGSKVDRYKKLGIPRRFQIHGHEVTVRIIQLSKWRHSKSAVGIWDPTTHRIDLCNDLGDTELQQVFCHELVHAVLDEMKHKISYDEKFVDNFGSLLHQALQTFTTAPR
jgi:D-hexose-6-phosphate mutarotase